MSLFNALPKHCLRFAQKQLDLSRPQVMGILNVTPDSFSDGGEYNSEALAIRRCQTMLDAGASIIDVGGESTRPGAKPVSTDEQIRRVVPIITRIRTQFGKQVWVSVDTSDPAVMTAAVQVGADIWNDVRALRYPQAPEVAAKLGVPVILMHMRGDPDTMSEFAHYHSVVDTVVAELDQRISVAMQAGVAREQLIIDPGFGFAKTDQHHCQLLTQLSALQALDLPVMLGLSRKRFLAQVLKKSAYPAFNAVSASGRDPVGMAAAILAVQQGVSIVRTHNVAMTTQALTLWQQLSQDHVTD